MGWPYELLLMKELECTSIITSGKKEIIFYSLLTNYKKQSKF
jgi:hypothetical protein